MNKSEFKIHIFIIASLTLLFFILLSSTYGFGIASDTTVYFDGAKNIVLNKGFVDHDGNFINHFPPFYSLVLALLMLFQGVKNIFLVSKIMSIIIVMFFNVLTFKIFLRLTKNIYYSYFLLFWVNSSNFFEIYFWNLTEGIFIVFLIWQFLLIQKTIISNFQVSKKTWRILGLLSAIMVMTRFAGFSVLGFWVIIALFSIREKNPIRNIVHIFSNYLIWPLVICGSWFTYVKLNINEEAVSRELLFHPPNIGKILELINTMLVWFSGNNKISIVFILVFFLIYLKNAGIVKNMDRLKLNLNRFDFVMFIFILYYIFFILVSFSLFDAHIQFDSRIFSPIFIPLVILGLSVVKSLTSSSTRRFKNTVSVLLVIGLFLPQLFYCLVRFREFHTEGLGYMSNKYVDSKAINFIGNKSSTVIWTNFPQLLRLHVDNGIVVRGTPLKYNTNTQVINSSYEKEVLLMWDQIIKNKEMIFLFKDESRAYYFHADDLLDDMEYIKSIHPNILINEYSDALICAPKL